jgi:hypothetical protein
VLGEAALLSAQPARAVAAYEKAVDLEPRDQQILTVGREGFWVGFEGSWEGVWEGCQWGTAPWLTRPAA